MAKVKSGIGATANTPRVKVNKKTSQGKRNIKLSSMNKHKKIQKGLYNG